MWGGLFLFAGLVILGAGSFYDGQKKGLMDANVDYKVQETKGEILFTFGAVFIMIGVIINMSNKFDTMFLSSGIALQTIGIYYIGKMQALKDNSKSYNVEQVRGFLLAGFGVFFVITGYYIQFTTPSE